MARKKLEVGETVDKNIRRRGDMQYAVEIRRKGITVNDTFLTLEDARIYRDRALSEIRASRFESPTQLKQTTFADLVDLWLQRNPNGSTKDRNRFKFLKTFDFAKMTLHELKSSIFATFRDDRLNGNPKKNIVKRAPDTVRNDLAAASKLFELARTDWGFPSLKNPLKDVKRPRSVARERRLLEIEEPHLRAALEGGRNPMLKHVVLFALESAMRQQEIAALTWSRVDLKQGTAKLRGRDTKTKKPRTVTLTDEAIEILREVQKYQKPNTPVFHCTQDAIDNGWEHILYRARESYYKECRQKAVEPEAAVFADLRFHDLRHEATSRFVSRLGNLSHVQSITGHETLAMLQRYTHLMVADVRAALDRTKRSASPPPSLTTV